MTMPTARYLVKLARDLRKPEAKQKMGKSVITSYLSQLWESEGPCLAHSPQEFTKRETQIALFGHRARRMIVDLVEAVDEVNGNIGLVAAEAYAAAIAHTQNLIVSVFWDKIDELEKQGTDGKVVEVLKKLAALNGLYLISKHAGEFLEDRHLDRAQIRIIRKAGE